MAHFVGLGEVAHERNQHESHYQPRNLRLSPIIKYTSDIVFVQGPLNEPVPSKTINRIAATFEAVLWHS